MKAQEAPSLKFTCSHGCGTKIEATPGKVIAESSIVCPNCGKGTTFRKLESPEEIAGGTVVGTIKMESLGSP